MAFLCTECQATFIKWSGRCLNCQAWESLVETEEDVSIESNVKDSLSELSKDTKPQALKDIELNEKNRISSGFINLDSVLGGGIYPSSIILLSGEPGIGKSTLLLQIASNLAKKGKVLYTSGEESLEQIKQRAKRMSLEDSEFILISLEDYDRLYRVDDVITLPTIDLIKELDLSNLDIVTTYNELKDTRKSPTFLKIVLINDKLNAIFKTDEEDLSSSYMVIPLQYEEDINKDRVWYSNINTEFLHQFFDIRVSK